MAKVLLVEDDPLLEKNLRLNLELDGYKVVSAENLKRAGLILDAENPDLVILDLNLPDGHGFVFLKENENLSSGKIPTIILTAISDEDSVVEGLTLGARDYMRKPFGYRELLIRIKAVLREPLRSTEKQIKYGDLTLSDEQRAVKYKENFLKIHRREFDVLKVLMQNAEKIVSRNQLLEHLDKNGEIFDRTIDSHISHLRAHFRNNDIMDIKISSVYGLGYRLEKVSL